MLKCDEGQASALLAISRDLAARAEALSFPSAPYVYNPLRYAWAPHAAYLERWGSARPREALLVGLNPGPFGMAQTGVPFGDVTMVREFLGLEGPVGKPPREHPRRPVAGFDCTKPEVSGRRFWGWARARCGTPERFFARVFVWNWCPLAFMVESGRNLTPDRLPRGERAPLEQACDEALARVVRLLRPKLVVGIGRFAEGRACIVVGDAARVGYLLHPSPASPAANDRWAEIADGQLRELGLELCGERADG